MKDQTAFPVIPEPAAARIVAIVSNAANVLPPMWPMASFIAWNPLRAFEDRPFREVVGSVGGTLGGAGLLDPATYRRFCRDGRIAATALRRAFERTVGVAGHRVVLRVAGHSISIGEVQQIGLFADPGPDAAASPLWQAAAYAAQLYQATTGDSGGPGGHRRVAADGQETLARSIDRHVARWCAAYLDAGQAPWSMPYRDRGLWAAWRRLAPHQPAFTGKERAALRAIVATLPPAAYEATAVCLRDLAVDEADWQDYLQAHLLRLPGWASYIKWRSEQAAPGSPEATIIADYLAIRLAVEVALRGGSARLSRGRASVASRGRTLPVPKTAAVDGVSHHELTTALFTIARHLDMSPIVVRGLASEEVKAVADALAALPKATQSLIWLEAHEETYRDSLLDKLARSIDRRDGEALVATDGPPPAAQLVFCIDVRSEPIRRHIEQVGPYQTLGFAGFFGVPVRWSGFADGRALDMCPALLKPRYVIGEKPAATCGHDDATRHRHGKAKAHFVQKVVSGLKGSVGGSFGFVEALGGLFAAPFIGKTFRPDAFARVTGWLHHQVVPPIDVAPDVVASEGHRQTSDGIPYGLTFDERVFFAEASLGMMGLTRGFARIVVFNGHGSQTDNNPYAAALDCGACGGNPGGPSARILAAILNEPAVRDALAGRGIVIPAETVFVAGEHNTTTDAITLYNTAAIPASHQAELAALERDLAIAREHNCRERASKLPLAELIDGKAAPHTFARAVDWAQVRPEWGLAGNAAFIVGPRTLTAGLNLEGRTFLHSYDWTADPSGKALEIILTAPMVVAELINTQYYFSTVDNERFGSGTKVTHNVVGLIGVMQGNESDLQVGLPQQSVMTAPGTLFHEPLRLMTVVLAPLTRVAEIIDNNPALRRLFENEWVALVVIEPTTGAFLRYGPGRTWQDVSRTPGGPGKAVATTATDTDADADWTVPVSGPAVPPLVLTR